MLSELYLCFVSFPAFYARLFSIHRASLEEFNQTTPHDETGHDRFDGRGWYSLGRIVGGAIYPGLMIVLWYLQYFFPTVHLHIDWQFIVKFSGPVFCGLIPVATYLLTKEFKDTGAGLAAAALIALVPGYVPVAYRGQDRAVFCMLLTYYFWLKSLKTNSFRWPTACANVYFYMVCSWGGDVFLVNLIQLHVLVLICIGRFSQVTYAAYSKVFLTGLILSLENLFIGDRHIQTREHLAAFSLFVVCSTFALLAWVNRKWPHEFFSGLTVFSVNMLRFTVLLAALFSKLFLADGIARFSSILNAELTQSGSGAFPDTVAAEKSPITVWLTFHLQGLFFLMFPVGLLCSSQTLTDSNIFLLMYAVTSIYFAGFTSRLMLPVISILSGIGLSAALLFIFRCYTESRDPNLTRERPVRDIQPQYWWNTPAGLEAWEIIQGFWLILWESRLFKVVRVVYSAYLQFCSVCRRVWRFGVFCYRVFCRLFGLTS